jgi:hypothetical protein
MLKLTPSCQGPQIAVAEASIQAAEASPDATEAQPRVALRLFLSLRYAQPSFAHIQVVQRDSIRPPVAAIKKPIN